MSNDLPDYFATLGLEPPYGRITKKDVEDAYKNISQDWKRMAPAVINKYYTAYTTLLKDEDRKQHANKLEKQIAAKKAAAEQAAAKKVQDEAATKKAQEEANEKLIATYAKQLADAKGLEDIYRRGLALVSQVESALKGMVGEEAAADVLRRQCAELLFRYYVANFSPIEASACGATHGVDLLKTTKLLISRISNRTDEDFRPLALVDYEIGNAELFYHTGSADTYFDVIHDIESIRQQNDDDKRLLANVCILLLREEEKKAQPSPLVIRINLRKILETLKAIQTKNEIDEEKIELYGAKLEQLIEIAKKGRGTSTPAEKMFGSLLSRPPGLIEEKRVGLNEKKEKTKTAGTKRHLGDDSETAPSDKKGKIVDDAKDETKVAKKQ